MKFLCILWIVFLAYTLQAQDNCNAFLWEGDTAKYKSCMYVQRAPSHFQLTRQFHEIRDVAIKMAPHYSYPYWAKSIAYLKTGDFITWKPLIDSAVSLDEEKYLGYRGWCRFQFFRDNEGAIRDFKRLEELFDGDDIGYSQNGDYHLTMAKALCFKMLGEKERAVQIMEEHLGKTAAIMPYDYLHLGVMHLNMQRYDDALDAFGKQSEFNELADNQYYIAKAHNALGDETQKRIALELAAELYAERRFMNDVYTHPVDKVYLEQIEQELLKLN